MFQKIAKHRANDASNDVHRPPLGQCDNRGGDIYDDDDDDDDVLVQYQAGQSDND